MCRLSKIKISILIALLASIVFSASGSCETRKKALPGPRELLTARDVGAYGGWNEYWFKDDSPFTYLIVQAVMTHDGHIYWHGNESRDKDREWNQNLLRARAKGVRVIADLGNVAADDSLDLKNFDKGLGKFLEIVDEDQLYAITISEENIFWDGRQEELKAAYYNAKKICDVPMYQWYSPSGSAPAPGFGAWPHLPADGWMLDSYTNTGPAFEEMMRGYSAHQVPVIQIVWGSPAHRSYNWETGGEPAFDFQLAVCRKYNVPTAFFMWEGSGGTWGWDPGAMPSQRRVYDRVVDWAEQAARTDLKAYATQWDDHPALQPLTFLYTAKGDVSFGEDFKTGGGSLAKGSVRRGFRDIRWHGGPLEFRPRQTGTTSAVIQYPLMSDIPLRDLKIVVNGGSNARLQGSISVAASVDGRNWTAEQLVTGSAPFTVSLTGDPRFQGCQKSIVRFTLKGRVAKVGEVPAFISDFNVSGAVVKPVTREISLRTVPGSLTKWSIVPSGSQLFTAEIDNPQQVESNQAYIGMRSMPNSPNKVMIRQKFVCPNGLDLRKLTFWSYGDQKNYGAINTLGVSLDGKDVLFEKSTAGIDDNLPKVTYELPDDARLKNVKEFWLHIGMRSDSTRLTTNEIRYLAVEGVGSQPAVASP